MAGENDDILERLLAHPEARREALRLIKRVDPEFSVPEVEIEDAVNARLAEQEKAHREEIEALRAEQRTERLTRSRDEQWGRMVSEGVVSDSEREAVEALVVDQGFPTIETAARYFNSQRKPPEEPTDLYTRNALEASGLDEFLADPDGAADKTAHEMIEAFSRGRYAH